MTAFRIIMVIIKLIILGDNLFGRHFMERKVKRIELKLNWELSKAYKRIKS